MVEPTTVTLPLKVALPVTVKVPPNVALPLVVIVPILVRLPEASTRVTLPVCRAVVALKVPAVPVPLILKLPAWIAPGVALWFRMYPLPAVLQFWVVRQTVPEAFGKVMVCVAVRAAEFMTAK